MKIGGDGWDSGINFSWLEGIESKPKSPSFTVRDQRSRVIEVWLNFGPFRKPVRWIMSKRTCGNYCNL